MSIQVDTSKWIKGKNYPNWMDDIAVSMISLEMTHKRKVFTDPII